MLANARLCDGEFPQVVSVVAGSLSEALEAAAGWVRDYGEDRLGVLLATNVEISYEPDPVHYLTLVFADDQ